MPSTRLDTEDAAINNADGIPQVFMQKYNIKHMLNSH